MDRVLNRINKKITTERITKIIDLVKYRRDRTTFYPISSSLSKGNSLFKDVINRIQVLIKDLPNKGYIITQVRQHSNPIIYYSIIENQINKKYFVLKNILEREIRLKIPFGDLKVFVEKEYIFRIRNYNTMDLRWYRMFNPRDGFKRITWKEYQSRYLNISKVNLGNINDWRIEPFGYVINMGKYYYYIFPTNVVVRLTGKVVDRVLKVFKDSGRDTGWFMLPLFGRSFVVKSKYLNIQPSMPYLSSNRINIDYNKYINELVNYLKKERDLKNIIKKINFEGKGMIYDVSL